MAEGREGSSQGMGIEAAPNMVQMFQAMGRQFVTAIIDLRREAPREEECGFPVQTF
jgi:hypothetical protein